MNFHICINILIGGRLKIWNFKSMILKGQHTKAFKPFYFCYIHGFYSEDHLRLMVGMITGVLARVPIVSVNKSLNEKVCDGFVHKLSLSVVFLAETRLNHAQKWFVEML